MMIVMKIMISMKAIMLIGVLMMDTVAATIVKEKMIMILMIMMMMMMMMIKIAVLKKMMTMSVMAILILEIRMIIFTSQMMLNLFLLIFSNVQTNR